MKYERVVLYDVYLGLDKINEYPMNYKEIRQEYGGQTILDKHGLKLIPSVFFTREVLHETVFHNG